MAQTANTTVESTDILKQLESKMSGIMGIVDSLSKKVDETNDMFVSTDSAYFANMASAIRSSLHESEMDRRLYDEAMEQNRCAMEMSKGRVPERGDANFWESAFAPSQTSPVELQASVLKKTFGDSGVMDAFKNMIGGIGRRGDDNSVKDVIGEALRGQADGRTLGDRALDAIGFHSITKLKNWFADRDLRKEEKATSKDQGIIKREQKQMDRLAAKYRKMKTSGADEEELLRVREQFDSHRNSQEAAATRIRERRNDDLAELDSPVRQLTAGMSELGRSLRAATRDGTVTGMPAGGSPLAGMLTGFPAVLDQNARHPVPTTVDRELGDWPRVKNITGDRNEPVELVKETRGTLAPAGDAREAMDIQRRLDTTLRPDFYREGTAFFKKANSGELLSGLSGALGGGFSGAAKAGMYAAAATAVVASIAKIGQAAMLVKDWYTASSEAVDNVKKMTESNTAVLEKRKNGVNDSMLSATQESLSADQKLHESEQSKLDSVGDLLHKYTVLGLFHKSDRQKAREAAENAEKKRREEVENYTRMRESAQRAGVDTGNTEEMKKFSDLYKKGNAEQYSPGREKLAAGNLSEPERADTVQTPGYSVEFDKVESADEQMKRQEEATFNAMKRALLDIDVQRKNEENAKLQGREIDQSLNGRK